MISVLSPPPYRHWSFPVCVFTLDFIHYLNPFVSLCSSRSITACVFSPRQAFVHRVLFHTFDPVLLLVSPVLFSLVYTRYWPTARFWPCYCLTFRICLPVSTLINLLSVLIHVTWQFPDHIRFVVSQKLFHTFSLLLIFSSIYWVIRIQCTTRIEPTPTRLCKSVRTFNKKTIPYCT